MAQYLLIRVNVFNSLSFEFEGATQVGNSFKRKCKGKDRCVGHTVERNHLVQYTIEEGISNAHVRLSSVKLER